MNVGKNIKAKRSSWNFQDTVPDEFVDHVRLSVPGYDEGHELICRLSDFFCQSESLCYEIGVSTGELLKKVAEYSQHKPEINWFGLDIEPKMIRKAEKHCKSIKNITLVCEDIRLFELEKCDFIISYYCMQFIPARYRQDIFNKIYNALNWGGGFVLFEKVRAPDARFQDIQVALYNEFKLRNGFSAEEIINKSLSLKGVLDPFSTQGNLDLLARAGFTDVMTVMKNICFEGFLAIK